MKSYLIAAVICLLAAPSYVVGEFIGVHYSASVGPHLPDLLENKLIAFLVYAPVAVLLNWIETTFLWERYLIGKGGSLVQEGDVLSRFGLVGPVTVGLVVGFLVAVSLPGGLLMRFMDLW